MRPAPHPPAGLSTHTTAGEVVNVRFFYAFRESGSVFQPVYLGPRSDIPAEECTVDQLKFKPEPTAV